MRKRNAILLLLLTLLTWKLLRTDWIVWTHYRVYDAHPSPSESFSIETFSPPVSPFWHPPQPHDIDPTATTWGDGNFFLIGGAWGPTEEPHLAINWPLILIKLAFGAGAGWFAYVVAFRVVPHLVRQAKTPV